MTVIPYTRQLGFFDPLSHPNAAATMIGLGGIGSFTAITLAKLGVPRLQLVDFDSVESHNIPNQLFNVSDIGTPKAIAAAQLCRDLSPIDAQPFVGKLSASGYEGDDELRLTEVTLSGLDSMSSRSDVWASVKHNPRVKIYLDARIAGQLIVVYAVNPMSPDDIDSYERTLHSDEDAMPAPCTERGVIDVGMSVAAILSRLTRAYYDADDTIDPVTVFNISSLSLTSGEWVL